ncbi:hypothetical protein [Paraclostridium dentum]|uniref:hypothetical protein n=1 Tax=Paraclostridium dentum TaxID=2662455 RepID=UPI0034644A50
MDINQKVDRYKELFSEDPLYHEIKRRGLLDDLFKPCLLFERIYFDSSANFSTKQAAELLEIPGKGQTLLNFLNRHEFTSYIEIYRQGSRGFYRYDYKTLFQFKMILMLTDLGLSPADIATLVGTRPEYSESYRRTEARAFSTLPSVDYEQIISDEVEEQLKNNFIAFAHQLNNKDNDIFEIKKLVYQQKIESIQEQLNSWERHMADTQEMISNAEINISMHEIHLATMKNPSEKSLFGFKIKEKTDPHVQEKVREFEAKLEEFKSYRSKLIERKNELEKEKIQLVSKDQTLKDYVRDLENNYNERRKKSFKELEMTTDYQNES